MDILPIRRTNRLKNYDYSQNGAYFVTLCIENHVNLLGDIAMIDENLQHSLTELGKCVDETITLANIDEISINKYVIMPNHVHMIIVIGNKGRLPLQSLVRYIKSCVTKRVSFPIWQKSFHDHIIRDEEDYARIWKYIENNPFRWTEDCYYNGELSRPSDGARRAPLRKP